MKRITCAVVLVGLLIVATVVRRQLVCRSKAGGVAVYAEGDVRYIKCSRLRDIHIVPSPTSLYGKV